MNVITHVQLESNIYKAPWVPNKSSYFPAWAHHNTSQDSKNYIHEPFLKQTNPNPMDARPNIHNHTHKFASFLSSSTAFHPAFQRT